MKKKYSYLLFFLGLVLILILLNIFNVVSVLEFFEARIIRPIQIIFYDLANKFEQPSGNLAEKNKELEIEIKKLAIENAQLKTQKNENEILRKELNFLKKTNYSFIVADVIGKIKEIPNVGQIIIDRGKRDGLRVGYPAIISGGDSNTEAQGFLIGKVIKVNQLSAQILLITDPQSSIAASVINTEGSFDGRVQATPNFAMEINLIPLDKQINQGDLVVTSGLESFIPQGLVIGRIGDIITKPNDLFQKALIKPFISFNNLKILTILKPSDESN